GEGVTGATPCEVSLDQGPSRSPRPHSAVPDDNPAALDRPDQPSLLQVADRPADGVSVRAVFGREVIQARQLAARVPLTSSDARLYLRSDLLVPRVHRHGAPSQQIVPRQY